MRLTLRGDVIDGRGLIKSSVSGKDAKAKQEVGGLRRRREDQRDDGTSRRDAAQRRSQAVAAWRANPQLLDERQDRARRCHRRQHRAAFVPPGDGGDVRGRGRAVPLRRHLSAHLWWHVGGGDGSAGLRRLAARRLHQASEFPGSRRAGARACRGGSGDPNNPNPRQRGGSGVQFSDMYAEFTRSPGRFSVRDGVVRGPAVGATVEGNLDYVTTSSTCAAPSFRSTASTTSRGRFQSSACCSAARKEGLLGVTYQVTGKPSAPQLDVNPMSALAPGFLRKIFEYRDQERAAPTTTGRADN